MSFHCPKCDRAVYDRTLKHCGYCGAELPAEFQLSEAELVRHAKWKAAREQGRKRKKDLDSDAPEDGADMIPPLEMT